MGIIRMVLYLGLAVGAFYLYDNYVKPTLEEAKHEEMMATTGSISPSESPTSSSMP